MKQLLLLTLLFFISCSSNELSSGVYTKSTTVENNLGPKIKAPWSEVQNNGSDLAFFNNKTKSYFLFNSSCRKFESSSLSTLTTSILTGIEQIEYLDKKTVLHQEREASLLTAKGMIDGVKRYFKILTTQKNNCIYDYVLISTNEKNLNNDTSDFNDFIQLLKLK